MNAKVIIDEDTCIGYGECVSVDSDAVALQPSGCARVLVATLDLARAEALCAVCPTGAISLQQEEVAASP